MKQKKLIVGLILVWMVIVLFISGCGEAQNNSSVASSVADELKTISVTVVYADESEKVFDIETDAEFLGEAMLEQKLITEEEYKSGFYTEIDGVRADYNADKAWWCVTKGGEMTSKGLNDLPIKDGDSFEITYTPS